jgi:tRNA pseudouridine38-40 synthase
MPYRYFIKLAFNGSDFKGWQVQPNSVTIQSEIEKALAMILHHIDGITGCGRTDSGVHAKLFYAHLDVEEPIKSTDDLAFKLNRFLPPSISISSIVPVKAGAHARFSALMREYTYTIITHKDPFLFQNAYTFTSAIDLDRMNDGAKLLMNYSDFECFSKVKTQVANFRCNLIFAEWNKQDHILKFTIRSDRFLRNMVRSIVGTLLDLGQNKISMDDLKLILLSHDRQKAGRSVPANGLFLTDIQYPANIFILEPEWFSKDSLKEVISHHNTNAKFHDGTGNEADE